MAEMRLLNPLLALFREVIVPDRGAGRTEIRAPGTLFTLAVLVIPVVLVILTGLFALAALCNLTERGELVVFGLLII